MKWFMQLIFFLFATSVQQYMIVLANRRPKRVPRAQYEKEKIEKERNKQNTKKNELKLQRLQDAYELLKKASAAFGNGKTKPSQERLAEAIFFSTEAVAILPTDGNTYYNQGIALEASGRHMEAVDAYENAVRLSPNELACALNYGEALTEVGRHREAVTVFNENIMDLLEFQPAKKRVQNLQRIFHTLSSSSDKLFGHGSAFEMLGRIAEANVFYHSAIAINPMHVQTLRKLDKRRYNSNFVSCYENDENEQICENSNGDNSNTQPIQHRVLVSTTSSPDISSLKPEENPKEMPIETIHEQKLLEELKVLEIMEADFESKDAFQKVVLSLRDTEIERKINLEMRKKQNQKVEVQKKLNYLKMQLQRLNENKEKNRNTKEKLVDALEKRISSLENTLKDLNDITNDSNDLNNLNDKKWMDHLERHWMKKSEILRSLHRFDEAMVAINKAILLKPRQIESHFRKALIFGDLEKPYDALEVYDVIRSLISRDTDKILLYDIWESRSKEVGEIARRNYSKNTSLKLILE